MESLILAIDIGNTNIVLGVYKEDALVADFRISTDKTKTEDEYGMLITELFKFKGLSFNIDGVIISSVVPNIVPVIADMCLKYFNCKPMIVGPGIKTGLEIKYENPKEVGADRIVNAVAALEKHDSNLIIVDFGTATTFCVVTKDGDYLGGAIAPGIGISSEALFTRAAKLPKVEISKPLSVIGKNTTSSMQSGIYYGSVGQVNEIILRIKAELKTYFAALKIEYTEPVVVATGGLARKIASDSQMINEVDDYLTIRGLKILYDKNKDV